jgi:hypothetical protein
MKCDTLRRRRRRRRRRQVKASDDVWEFRDAFK